ncbi:hypothetical protein LRAMOSA06153 [Lichtheimia ramosa]|uniref:HMG box domain-containing protein n=1 Tax=Lichtheimia ramosa TaxID=688394 RepID=A0A077X2G5_9FUNG|nr:hypothetical protein LRAMOSA06153 [Lichtheimia ramosa]
MPSPVSVLPYSGQRDSTSSPNVTTTTPPLELPPILDMSSHCNTTTSTSITTTTSIVNGPPSPTSPQKLDGKQHEELLISSSPVAMSSLQEATVAPAFLEPAPQLDNHRISHYEPAFRPLLFSTFKGNPFKSSSTCHSSTTDTTSTSSSTSNSGNGSHRKWKFFTHKIPSLQIPVPRRSFPVLQPKSRSASSSSSKENNHHHRTRNQQQHPNHQPPQQQIMERDDQPQYRDVYSPMSPTMATASAAAAAAAVKHHPGSSVAEAFLKCLRLSGLQRQSTTPPPPCSLSSSSSSTHSSSSEDEAALLEEQDPATRLAAEALAAASADAHHRAAQGEKLVSLVMHQKKRSSSSGLDHTQFLTKNAHIKRPRNAWIHFRCHYGQALKSQDPTLRAEEISKRASHRWGRLSEKEKKPWHALAEQEKLAHKEAFPEYRYCPKRHSSSSTASSSTTSSTLSSLSTPTSATKTNQLLHFHHDIVDAQSMMSDDSGSHRYKKARRRTK